MKKIIAAMAAAAMLVLSGAAAVADDYEPVTDTEVEEEANKEPRPGKKVRFVVDLGVNGDASQCTGEVLAIFKKAGKVLKQRSKAADAKVAFAGKIPLGADKVVFIYQRGENDPCDKSRSDTKF